ncbi:uncharacterized protein METZ01_LOCUS419727, partial [marine metagenome]
TLEMMDRFVLGDGAKASWDGLIDEVAVWTSTLTAENAVWLAKNSIAWLGLENGLVAYYPFNGNANDESGNGNDGEVNGATLTADRNGGESKAYSFDGVSSYIKINNSENLNPNYITLNVWISLREINENFKEHALIHKPRNLIPYALYVNSKNQGIEKGNLSFYFSDAGPRHTPNGISDGGFALSVDEWTMATVTYDGKKINTYNNGEKVITYNVERYPKLWSSNYPVIIGALVIENEDIRSEFFNGQLDDIRIYNRALSEAEVAALYELEK